MKFEPGDYVEVKGLNDHVMCCSVNQDPYDVWIDWFWCVSHTRGVVLGQHKTKSGLTHDFGVYYPVQFESRRGWVKGYWLRKLS